MPVSIMFLIILTPAVVWHGFLALVPRSIACIGLLLIGLLWQAQAATSVRLAWNPGTSSGIAGYRVHYGTSSGSYPQIFNVGSTTTVTVSGLIPGQTYYFVVTDYNTVGLESLPSNEVSFTSSANGIGTAQTDLVWENTTTGEHSIWFLNNGVLSSIINLPTIPIPWHIAAAADSPGNGQVDLVWENTSTGEHSIWAIQNGVLSASINLLTIATEWRVAAAADFVGTGQAGLVWENTSTGEHSIWILNNGVLSSTISLPTIPTEWHVVD